MKARLYILVLLLVIGWSSCTRRTTYPLFIQEAVKCMDSRPDRALELLKYLEDSLSSYPEETQMYYHLLSIQAKDKQYITHTDDSLINCIVEFYENRDDADKKMMAYYYQGSTYRDMNDAPRALKSYQQAIDISSPDNELLPKVYNQMGALFAYQGLYDEAIKISQRQIDFYKKRKEPNKASYAFRDIARIHDVKEQHDSALYYYNKACEMALIIKDSVRYYNIASELGGFYYEIDNKSLAKKILLSVQNKPQIVNKAHIYPFLGYIYMNEQKWDSAYYYFRKTLGEGNLRQRFHTFYDLSRLETKRGKYKRAIDYMNQYIFMKDSVDKITKTETVAKINSLYNYQHTEKENHQLKFNKEKQKNTILLLLLTISILFVTGTFLFNIQRRKNRLALEHEKKLKEIEKANYVKSLEAIAENNKKISELDAQLKKAQKNTSNLEHELILIQKKKLELRNKEITVDKNEQELRIAVFQQSSIYYLLQRAAADESNKVTDEDWDRIASQIDYIYPDFSKHLYELYPQLSKIELHICWLTKLSFSPANIARILLRSKSAITNARVRLHKKIHKTDGTSEQFDEFIKKL
ncbi:MAG: tetratricopeptide repeat protein [Bacteroidaceae bacterium]|nr:tetratricopeptide repeat protein [Bacteroidaceae bacterium]